MFMQIECPTCGTVRDLPCNTAIGSRTVCRQCGSLLEILTQEPVQVIKIKLQAEDFGI